MALTFPRAMPTVGVASQAFDIGRQDYLSPETGGRLGAVSAGFPLWRMSASLVGTDEDATEEWIAFVDAQRGPMRTFLACDLTRPYPKAYPSGFAGLNRAGGGSFAAGTATSWSVNGTRDVLTLNGMPSNFAVTRRDYVGFVWTTSSQPRRALVRSVEPVTGSSGGAASFSIEPPLPTLVPAGATALLANADCLMRLVPGETRIGELDLLRAAGGSIVAVQELLA